MVSTTGHIHRLKVVLRTSKYDKRSLLVRNQIHTHSQRLRRSQPACHALISTQSSQGPLQKCVLLELQLPFFFLANFFLRRDEKRRQEREIGIQAQPKEKRADTRERVGGEGMVSLVPAVPSQAKALSSSSAQVSLQPHSIRCAKDRTLGVTSGDALVWVSHSPVSVWSSDSERLRDWWASSWIWVAFCWIFVGLDVRAMPDPLRFSSRLGYALFDRFLCLPREKLKQSLLQVAAFFNIFFYAAL